MVIASTGAGHGGLKTGNTWTDPGAIGSDINEADLTRMINNKILSIAKCKDTTDNAGKSINANLANITQSINKGPDGWALSHHLNAFNKTATGVEVLYGSEDSKTMATRISATIANALGIDDRGAKDGSWLYIARNTSVNKKVLLIEWCFIDNAADVSKLLANMDRAVGEVMKIFGYANSTDSALQLGDRVRVTGTLYQDSYGMGSSTAKQGSEGSITKIASGNPKPYLVENWGWGNSSDLTKYLITGYPKKRVGDAVTIQNFATHWQTGEAIPSWVKGQSYKIIEVKTVNQSKSKRAYLLENIVSWILEQDIK